MERPAGSPEGEQAAGEHALGEHAAPLPVVPGKLT
jgi:hypothetical protein